MVPSDGLYMQRVLRTRLRRVSSTSTTCTLHVVSSTFASRSPLTKRQIEALARDFYTPFQKVSVYHKMKFWNGDALGRENGADVVDTVHVKPGYQNKKGHQVGGPF
ncbi:hypothetical protein B0H14DRAFT_3897972 [Mycena olivaceomarginata]|nr:hypothetical protein B0H14DRAFT_3897972 [Mycena olivaceomarginata]